MRPKKAKEGGEVERKLEDHSKSSGKLHACEGEQPSNRVNKLMLPNDNVISCKRARQITQYCFDEK